MTKCKLIPLGALLASLCAVAANAQVTLDVSKVTCKQYRTYEIVNPRDIALWLSGYYNAMKHNTIIQPQRFKQDISKVNEYCLTNPDVPVMQAVEKVLGGAK